MLAAITFGLFVVLILVIDAHIIFQDQSGRRLICTRRLTSRYIRMRADLDLGAALYDYQLSLNL